MVNYMTDLLTAAQTELEHLIAQEAELSERIALARRPMDERWTAEKAALKAAQTALREMRDELDQATEADRASLHITQQRHRNLEAWMQSMQGLQIVADTGIEAMKAVGGGPIDDSTKAVGVDVQQMPTVACEFISAHMIGVPGRRRWKGHVYLLGHPRSNLYFVAKSADEAVRGIAGEAMAWMQSQKPEIVGGAA